LYQGMRNCNYFTHSYRMSHQRQLPVNFLETT